LLQQEIKAYREPAALVLAAAYTRPSLQEMMDERWRQAGLYDVQAHALAYSHFLQAGCSPVAQPTV